MRVHTWDFRWSLWMLLFLATYPCVLCDFAFADFQSVKGLHMQGITNHTQNWLRLTSSRPGVVGSAWYETKQLVIGGFSTELYVRLKTDDDQMIPGPCKLVSHPKGGEDKQCSRRAGNGFAFVIQNTGLNALGNGGADMGYAGLMNGLAIEFDTWYDPHLQDPYENHLAVLTRGKEEMWATHTANIGNTIEIPDLCDGEQHLIKIEYDPEMHPARIQHPSFKAAAHLAQLVYPTGSYWKSGLGLLRIWVDDAIEPVLTVPCNLGSWLGLDAGRAYVGLTASTGASYQNHDVMSWIFLEEKSETLSTQARAGVLVRGDYDAVPHPNERWADPAFARTHNYPGDATGQPSMDGEPNLFA